MCRLSHSGKARLQLKSCVRPVLNFRYLNLVTTGLTLYSRLILTYNDRLLTVTLKRRTLGQL